MVRVALPGYAVRRGGRFEMELHNADVDASVAYPREAADRLDAVAPVGAKAAVGQVELLLVDGRGGE